MDDSLQPEVFWPRLRAALLQIPLRDRTPPARARVGAVLVLLEQTADGPRVVLTRRRRDLRSHPGQVSFAGGRLDPGETIHEAALREAHEEIGLRPESTEVVGAGATFYIPPSRFWVAPVVARWVDPHALAENPWEVDQVLHVPLAQLLEPDRWRYTPSSERGASWAWQLDEDLLWGATAVVMSTLLDLAVEGWNRGRSPQSLGERRAVRPWEDAAAWQRRPRLESGLPERPQGSVPHVTASQVRRARAWADDHGVEPLLRAEHAGRALAHTVRRLNGGETQGITVTVLAGPSSNGSGGLAAARLLAIAGADVEIVTVGAPRFPEQVHGLRETGIPIVAVDTVKWDSARAPGEVVVDAMLGIGGQPPLRDVPKTAVDWLRHHDVQIVALDLPSGVSPHTGIDGPCITADVTVLLGLPTVGLRGALVDPFLGDLYLADIGLPAAAWHAAMVELPPESLFARGPLVRLTTGPESGS